jgi:hypothetical protein
MKETKKYINNKKSILLIYLAYKNRKQASYCFYATPVLLYNQHQKSYH